MNSIGELSSNSAHLTSAVVSLSKDLKSYIKCKQGDSAEADRRQTSGSSANTSHKEIRTDATNPMMYGRRQSDQRAESPDIDEYFSPFINYTESELNNGPIRRPNRGWSPSPPPSPEMAFHICSTNCPSYCEKVYDN